MKIYRNGKEIVLTDEEIMEAHAEHIKSFMRNELITVYGLPDEEAEDYAELAYSHYTSGNGYTEYDCIEWAVTIYDLPNLELEDSYLLLWPKGTKKFFSSLDDAVFAAATKVSFPFPAYEQIWILASNDKGKVVPVKKYRSSDLLLEDLWKSLTDVPFDPILKTVLYLLNHGLTFLLELIRKKSGHGLMKDTAAEWQSSCFRHFSILPKRNLPKQLLYWMPLRRKFFQCIRRIRMPLPILIPSWQIYLVR